MSLNLAFNNASSALDANQKAIAVHSDNIANASNINYKKRTTTLNNNGSVEIGKLSFGSGVKVASINREFNLVLETNLLNSQSQYGYNASYAYYLNNLENFLSPNGKNVIGTSMTKLQSTLNSAMNNLDNSGAQIELYQSLKDVANTLNEQYSQGLKIRESLFNSSANGEIKTNTDNLNRALADLQKVNKELEKAKIKGIDNNNLLDQRDALLKDIAEIVEVDVDYNANGTVDIRMPALVSGASENILLVDGKNTSNAAEQLNLGTAISAKSGLEEPKFTLSDGTIIDLKENQGSLNGMIKSVKYLDDKLVDLYKFSKTFTDKFNDVSRTAYAKDGTTNKNAFTPLAAIPPLPESEGFVEFLLPNESQLPLWDSVENINSADTTIIKKYQDVLNEDVAGTNYTVKNFSNEFLTKLSLDVKSANDNKTSAVNSRTMYKNAVSDYSSVDVNKEMAELMNVQNSFEAAATLMNTVNKMVNSAINMVN